MLFTNYTYLYSPKFLSRVITNIGQNNNNNYRHAAIKDEREK